MGMIACYMEADDSLIEEMENKVTEEIMESIEELGEEGELEVNDIDSALAAFSPLDFANNRVYPAIWKESEKEGLRKELLEEFVGLKAFYANMVNRGKGVIVSIY